MKFPLKGIKHTNINFWTVESTIPLINLQEGIYISPLNTRQCHGRTMLQNVYALPHRATGTIVTSTQNPVILVRAGAGTFNNDRIIG